MSVYKLPDHKGSSRAILRRRTAGTGSLGDTMRADGTPVVITGRGSSTLRPQRIGGKDGRHDERWLQRIIHDHPTCIPMDQIEPGLPTLVPICMELNLSCGYLDNLLMTPEGDIVIVEAKLFRNPESRREVVAQALDYATSLFGMDYTALEKAVLESDFGDAVKPAQLYDLFTDPDAPEEAAFIDAVNMNLKNGRIVVLVIGDGIRSNAEDLVSGLQSHAGFHFTFALIELAVFQGTTDDDLLIIPRTLAQTCMIERGIVRIDDERSEVIAVASDAMRQSSAMPKSITSEQFFESVREHNPDLPAVLEEFIEKLSNLAVYAEFRKALNFKWDAPSGKTVNLGYIQRGGQLWTDATHLSIVQSYLEDLAEQFGGTAILRDSGSGYVAIGGKAPNIDQLVDKLDNWYGAIERFQNRVRMEEAGGDNNG